MVNSNFHTNSVSILRECSIVHFHLHNILISLNLKHFFFGKCLHILYRDLRFLKKKIFKKYFILEFWWVIRIWMVNCFDHCSENGTKIFILSLNRVLGEQNILLSSCSSVVYQLYSHEFYLHDGHKPNKTLLVECMYLCHAGIFKIWFNAELGNGLSFMLHALTATKVSVMWHLVLISDTM